MYTHRNPRIDKLHTTLSSRMICIHLGSSVRVSSKRILVSVHFRCRAIESPFNVQPREAFLRVEFCLHSWSLTVAKYIVVVRLHLLGLLWTTVRSCGHAITTGDFLQLFAIVWWCFCESDVVFMGKTFRMISDNVTMLKEADFRFCPREKGWTASFISTVCFLSPCFCLCLFVSVCLCLCVSSSLCLSVCVL